MANYRYVYEYGGKRYVIEAPEGATESDLQSIISSAPSPKAQPKPQQKKEEEPFYSGFLPTLKKATGELGQDIVSLLSRIPSSADIFDPILGDRDTRPRPVAEALRKAAVGLTQRGEAELPEASRREAEAQRKFVAEAKPGVGSQILAGLGRAGAALPSFTPFDIGGLSQRLLPQTPEQAARAIAAVEAPFQTARGATEFIASQLPATAIPLGGGKAAQLGARPLARALGKDLTEEGVRRGVGAGVVTTGVALNAASAGRQAYDNVIKAGGTEEEANRAYNIAASGAALASGAAARMPGLEQQLFSGATRPGGIIRSTGRAVAGEAPQEFVEEGGAKLATNVGQLGTKAEVPIGEDVLSSATLGGIGGGIIAAPVGALQGVANRGAVEQELPPEAAAPRTAPRPSPPPADVGALSKALGPLGGKITLQEPSGPQEYTFQGFDEDGSVLLADAEGQIFAEDPDQIAAAMQVGAAEPEEGLGGMAFGMDITEGLEEPAAAAPEAAPEVAAPETVAPKVAAPAGPPKIAQSLQPGDVVHTDTGDTFTVSKNIPLGSKGDSTIIGTWDNGNEFVIKASELDTNFTPQPYTDANTGERKMGEAWTVERAAPEVAAPEPVAETAPVIEAAAAPEESIAPPEPKIFPVDKEVASYMDEYSRFRSADQMNQIMAMATDLAREKGKRSISRDELFNAAMQFDDQMAARGRPTPKQPPAPAGPTAPTGLQDLQPELERIMGKFHPQLREMFILPKIQEKIASGERFTVKDIPDALRKNIPQADRLIVARALAENPQQLVDVANAVPFTTPVGDVVYPTAAQPRAEAAPAKRLTLTKATPTQWMGNQMGTQAATWKVKEYPGWTVWNNGTDWVATHEGRPNVKSYTKPMLLEKLGRVLAAEEAAPEVVPPAPERVRTVTTPGGSKVNTAFEVVDAKDLTAASGELQNRDRSRAATDLQVQDIFSNFDPERLGESLESDRGSPIIGPDNVVESGNGRVMAINKVYNESPERADAYRKFIEAQGFDTSGIERPVLVRRRIDNLTPEARAQFVRESNMDTKLQLSTSERAQTDAASLTPDVMALMVSPDVSAAANQDFVRGFLSKLPPQEQAAFLDKNGRLSAEGIRRLRTAVKASAYGDADLINTLDESQDNNIKSIGGALEDVAPAWRRFRDAVADGTVDPEMDVTDNLVEAAKIVRDVRNQGMKINDFLAQQDAFNPLDPVTERFIRSFYNQKSGRASGREAIADVLEKYARRASEQTTTEGLFEREAMSPADILDGIMEGAEQGGLFNNGKGVKNNAQVMDVLDTGTPEQMKNAIAQAQKPDDKSNQIGADAQKKNRGCD